MIATIILVAHPCDLITQTEVAAIIRDGNWHPLLCCGINGVEEAESQGDLQLGFIPWVLGGGLLWLTLCFSQRRCGGCGLFPASNEGSRGAGIWGLKYPVSVTLSGWKFPIARSHHMCSKSGQHNICSCSNLWWMLSLNSVYTSKIRATGKVGFLCVWSHSLNLK